MLKAWIQLILFALTAWLALGATATTAKPAPKPAASATNWNTKVTRTANDGYILGNPAAPVHLVVYISYTCPHCAEFEVQSDAPLHIGMIAPGKGSVEIRPFLRSVVDVAASLLAECGPPAKFVGNTKLLLARQGEWAARAETLTTAQQARWDNPDFATRMRAIAGDLGLYALMEGRGYGRAELDRCLADKPLADRMAHHTNDAVEKEFIKGTPGFLIDNVPLASTYTWESLRPQLEARLH